MSKPAVLAEPNLVGREKELEELQSLLDAAIVGRGKTVFVSGEAGSGKTKLVTDFLNAATLKRDVVVLSGWCLSGAGIPYFPFVEAFSNYFSSSEKTVTLEGGSNDEVELNLWLKGPVRTGLSGSFEGTSAEAWKDLTFGAVKRSLTSISNKKPTILFIDDIQWADSASLALLHYLSRTISTNRVLVIAAFRSEELQQDEQGRPHPLSDTLRLMGRENLFHELNLSGLSMSDVGLLAENMIGGRVQTSLTERLQSESQGNPLFVVESLRMLSEKNCLTLQKNKWCLSISDAGIPTKVKGIILHRVDRLTHEQRKVLDVASVVGTKFDPELIASVMEMDKLKVLEALDSIAHASSLVVAEGTQYRFDHAKSRDALYEEMSPALRIAYHGEIAKELEANSKYRRPSDLAYHYRGAENQEKAVKYSLAAGEEALKFVLGTEAIEHFSYVLDNTQNDTSFTAERAIAMEGLGDGLFLNASSKSVKVYEQLYQSAPTDPVKARALRKAAYASLMEGNYGHALELVSKSLNSPLADRLENARFSLVKGMVEGWGGYGPEAKLDLQRALDVFVEEYSLVDTIETLSELAIGYILERSPDNSSSLGQPEKALASALCAHAIAKHTKDLSKQVNANEILFIIYNKCGLLKEAIDVVSENFQLGNEIGDPVSRASNQTWTYWMSGYLAEIRAVDRILSKLPLDKMQSFGTASKLKFYMSSIVSGTLSKMRQDLNFALNESLKGVEYAEEADFYEIQAFNYENLAREYAELGRMNEAETYFEKMEKIFKETSLSGFIFANIIYLFTKAVYFQSKRDWDNANRFYEEAIAYYKKISPATGIMAGIQQGYSWTLLQQGRFEDAKEQYNEAGKTNGELQKRLVHSNVLAYLMAPARAEVGKEFHVRLDLINVAKNAGRLVQIRNLLPPDSQVKAMEPAIRVENGTFDMQGETILPFQDKTVTITVQATKVGAFSLSPTITYVDDVGQAKNSKPLNEVSVNVQPPKPTFEVLPGRLSTGTSNLDRILLGGIPAKYAVALTAPSCVEEQVIVDSFVEVGARSGEPTLYLAFKTPHTLSLANCPTLFMFQFNPQVRYAPESLPNVIKFGSVENLTEINISLAKYFRKIDPSVQGPRRACIDILSDVLLQHRAITTRKWLSEFLANLKSKGFTTLAFIDAKMHPPEESEAILGLFDAEIRIAEKETPSGTAKTLKILKLQGQNYSRDEVTLG